jgi:hypothetical protein
MVWQDIKWELVGLSQSILASFLKDMMSMFLLIFSRREGSSDELTKSGR